MSALEEWTVLWGRGVYFFLNPHGVIIAITEEGTVGQKGETQRIRRICQLAVPSN